MTTAFVDLDVRPILRSGGEPFQMIMETVAALEPHQGLRLFATFKPAPLFRVLGARGFTPEAKELADGEWEVLFHRTGADEAGANDAPAATPAADDAAWPEPAQHLDNRDLDPPEPMVRALTALEELLPGEVLSVLLRREPVFLFPELGKRGHDWLGEFQADGKTYRLLVRKEVGKEAAA